MCVCCAGSAVLRSARELLRVAKSLRGRVEESQFLPRLTSVQVATQTLSQLRMDKGDDARKEHDQAVQDLREQISHKSLPPMVPGARSVTQISQDAATDAHVSSRLGRKARIVAPAKPIVAPDAILDPWSTSSPSFQAALQSGGTTTRWFIFRILCSRLPSINCICSSKFACMCRERSVCSF